MVHIDIVDTCYAVQTISLELHGLTSNVTLLLCHKIRSLSQTLNHEVLALGSSVDVFDII